MFADFADRVDYCMVVVTAHDGDSRSGCLVGFAAQVSIDPERFMVCLSKRNRTYDVALRCAVLAVHAIPAHRHDLAVRFGAQTGYDVDKFATTPWTTGPGDAVLLDECPLRFVGSVLRTDDWGDHVGFTLAPLPDEGTDVTARPAAEPLLTFQQVRDIEAGRPA